MLDNEHVGDEHVFLYDHSGDDFGENRDDDNREMMNLMSLVMTSKDDNHAVDNCGDRRED